MGQSKKNDIESGKPPLHKIGKTALIVGTFDILAAIFLTLLKGNEPVIVLRYIASGVFGGAAFSGGSIFIYLGLLFHYLFALLWTVLFFRWYVGIRRTIKNVVLIGMVYGLFVWAMMNLVIVPLSNASPIPFTIGSAIMGILVIITMVGLPLSFIVRKHYIDCDRSLGGTK